jgi:hypothetical protein
MNKLTFLIASAWITSLPICAQQGFDFKTLDKMGANARESTNITLDSSMLKLASGMLGNGKDSESMKALVSNLKGLYVRSYEFENAGAYNEADLGPLHTFLSPPQWSKVVDVREQGETSEVFMRPLPNDQLGGIAIIVAEAKELTVVYIDGTLNADDIGKLSGNLGIPNLSALNNLSSPKESQKDGKNKSKNKNKDKEE